ncbi:MAG: glycosyltransferase family 1 protein [Opitutaceae bacterium]|nr:glycosyltransferase family 1 protein [Opitutaceae bacterium]
MKIGVNLLFLQPQRNRGTFTYAYNLLCELAKLTDAELTLFVTKDNGPLFQDFPARQIKAPISGRNRVVRILCEQTWLPYSAKKTGCEVLFCPGYLAPLRSTVPVIVAIPDTQFRDIPQCFGIGFRLAYNMIVPSAARRAAAVITISEFSKQRILHHLALDSDRVFVTHLAPLPVGENTGPGDEADLRKRYGLGKPLLLSVSTASPHKNVDKLIDAFMDWRTATNSDAELVLVGQHQAWFEARYPNAKSCGVRLLGFVPLEDLVRIYRAAAAFILASSYEGFGLPVLEAMQFGLPVACSNCASLPEVGGAAALYFNPLEKSEVIRAIDAVMNDEGTRKMLVARIPENLKRFSWSKCAVETFAVCRSVANRGAEQATEG